MSVYQSLPKWAARRWAALSVKWRVLHPLCEDCKRRGLRTYADVVDHITPHRGNLKLLFDERNLQSLCHRCHSSGKQKSEIRGYEIGIGPDGYPVSDFHPFMRRSE